MLSCAGSLTEYGNIDTINPQYSITINPSGGDTMAYVADYDTYDIAMIDVSDAADWIPAAFYEAPGTTSSYSPRLVEFAQNGKFFVAGYAGSSSSAGLWVYSVPHDAAASGTYTVAGAGDTFSQNLYKPRGVAISPIMSILSPRPGKELSGRHRVQLLIRDPDVESVTYTLDGVAVSGCPEDTHVGDGVSDSCLLDTRGWTDSTEHVLRVTAQYSDGSEFFVEGRY